MSDVADDEGLYFRQLLSGRDFARGDQMARQMVNFVYLIGDRVTGEAVVVDPAYAVQDLLDILETDGMRLTGVLATHYHPDHVGGEMAGWALEGISALLEKVQVPVHLQSEELPWVERTTGVGASHLVGHDSGDVVRVGSVGVELIHTPGHTPGSQCFLVDGRLVAGDTGRIFRAPIRWLCTSRSTPAWPASPTTPCSIPATSTRLTRRSGWGIPANGTTSSNPAPLKSG
jgi:hypothetical protein